MKIKQLQHEIKSWKRSLSFITDENIQLKNRLIEMLKNKFNKNLLEQFESFQNRFIKEDEIIGLLRNSVAELDKLLTGKIAEDEKLIKEIDKKVHKLRNNIIKADQQFGQLKFEFNSYLSDNI